MRVRKRDFAARLRRGTAVLAGVFSALTGIAFAAVGSGSGPADSIVVDRAWNGAPVDFAGVFRAGFIYISYYDADRRLVAAKYDPKGRPIEKAGLDEFFGGWDAHNGIELELDRQGYVHLAANMHASPLVYFRSTVPYSVASLRRVAAMVGSDEAKVTYPRFIRRGDELLFTYRDGASGHGRWLLDRLLETGWTRAGVLFADRDSAGPASSYPTRVADDGAGSYTVAYVWRRGPDAALNHNLCFARTQDFATWYSLGAAPMRAPLGPNCRDPVAAPGPNRGLGNTPILLSDGRGTPIVLYSMLDEHGYNQVYLAVGENARWRSMALTHWTVHYDYRGKGSLPVPFAIAAAEDPGRNRILISIRHDLFGRSDFALDLASFTVRKLPRHSGSDPPAAAGESAALRRRVLPIRDETGARRASFSWSTLPSNSDLPPSCAGCESRASDLLLHMTERGTR